MKTNIDFTKVGSEILNWAPLRPRTIPARYLFIALLITPRRIIPGLFTVGIQGVCDIAKMTPEQTIESLDELITHELVEFDRNHEVLRLTELPDRCERPNNGSHLQALWSRFRVVPDCPVRNAHVRVVEWLLADPVLLVTSDHVRVWEKTFAQIAVPPVRKRGVRRLLDADTSTDVQPSLFHPVDKSMTIVGTDVSVIDPVLTASSTPVVYPTKLDTVPHTLNKQLISDQRSKISLLSGSGESNEHADSTQQEQISLPRSQPTLALVPLVDPYTVVDVLTAVASQSLGRFPAAPIDERIASELERTLRACIAAEVVLEDLCLVGRWLAAGGLGYRTDLGPVWASRPGNLIDAVASARAWHAANEPALHHARSRALPAPPAPSSAFTNGRRTL